MPNGIYPIPRRSTERPPARRGLLLRLRTRWRRRHLDEQLAPRTSDRRVRLAIGSSVRSQRR
jgi:hypothetical protein